MVTVRSAVECLSLLGALYKIEPLNVGLLNAEPVFRLPLLPLLILSLVFSLPFLEFFRSGAFEQPVVVSFKMSGCRDCLLPADQFRLGQLLLIPNCQLLPPRFRQRLDGQRIEIGLSRDKAQE